jgi:hypothetical protein
LKRRFTSTLVLNLPSRTKCTKMLSRRVWGAYSCKMEE